MDRKLINGIFWSAVDRFAVVFIQVVFEILLARVLLPYDYGLVGMVAIFIAVAQVFVDGGFMNALIQKKRPSELDYSTVFYTIVGISLVVYAVLFLTAPYIAGYYGIPLLKDIIRVLGLNVIFNSLALIYRTKLTISMNFKKQAKFSLISVLVSGLIGLFLAHSGYGVWALIYQLIILYGLNTVLLIFSMQWLPVLKFSKDSFNQLFGFGSKLLVAALIQSVYSNMYMVFIGKILGANKLGLYSKSSQFTLYPSSMITNMLQRVLYPYLVEYKDDNSRLFTLNKHYYTITSMFLFPVFFGLAVLAEPFVHLFLTDVWIEIVPLIRILAITYLFYPFININMYVFQIKGMSSRFLMIEILTKISGVIILIITLRYSLLIMCYGLLLQHFIQWMISSYFSDKAMKSHLFSQIRSLLPLILFSCISSLAIFQLMRFIDNSVLELLIGFLLIICSYGLFYLLFMKSNLLMLKQAIFK